MLTGIRDLNLYLLQELSDQDIGAVCKTSKYLRELCQDEYFWLTRLQNIYDNEYLEIVKNFLGFEKWRDLYIHLKENEIDNFALKTYLTHIGEYNQFFNTINWPEWINRKELENEIKRATVKYWNQYDSRAFKYLLTFFLPKIENYDWNINEFLWSELFETPEQFLNEYQIF